MHTTGRRNTSFSKLFFKQHSLDQVGASTSLACWAY